MTCIVGIAQSDGVTLGADSAGVSNYDLSVRADRKIFRIGEEIVIGFTDSFRMGQLLAVKLTPPPCHADVDLWRYMVGDFVEAVRLCLANGGYARKENNVETGGTFLVGFRGRLFRIAGDFQVGESTCGYDAVGCGAAYALGSLAETEGLGTTERVNRALRVAERFSAGVRAPFHVERTEAEKVRR